jgi:hypothetical protein
MVGGGFHPVGEHVGHLHQAPLGVLRRAEVHLGVLIGHYPPVQAPARAGGCHVVDSLWIPDPLLTLGWG